MAKCNNRYQNVEFLPGVPCPSDPPDVERRRSGTWNLKIFHWTCGIVSYRMRQKVSRSRCGQGKGSSKLGHFDRGSVIVRNEREAILEVRSAKVRLSDRSVAAVFPFMAAPRSLPALGPALVVQPPKACSAHGVCVCFEPDQGRPLPCQCPVVLPLLPQKPFAALQKLVLGHPQHSEWQQVTFEPFSWRWRPIG